MRFGDIVNGVVVANSVSFLCVQAFSNSFGSKEANEGMSAFVDKRKPKFKK